MKKSLIFASILLLSFAAGCDDGTGTGGAGGATASSSGASMSTSSASSSGSTTTATGSTSSATSSVSTGSAMGMFSLTSSAVREGMTLPPKYTCADPNQVSPPLAWTGAPAGAMSYAIVFTDKSIMDFKHSAIYDISMGVMALPEDVEQVYQPTVPAGAKQTKAWDGGFGYSGPCPPATHTYEFKIYALDVATLPGMTMNSTIAQVEAAALDHDLGVATLTVLGDP